MSAPLRILGTGLLFSIGLAACGGDGPAAEQPVNIDYSALRIAESREAPLVYARSDEEVLLPLRNGLRLAVGSVLVALPAGAFTPSVSAPGPHSDTTVQVEGVDEADSVKYDGRYIYSSRPEFVPRLTDHAAPIAQCARRRAHGSRYRRASSRCRSSSSTASRTERRCSTRSVRSKARPSIWWR